MRKSAVRRSILTYFEVLPDLDPVMISADIRQNLQSIKRSLSSFVDTIGAGRTLWPDKNICDRFVSQIQAFRGVARRSQRGRNFRIVREMDNRWRALRLGATIQKVADAVERYLADSVFAALRTELAEMGRATKERRAELVRTKQLILKLRVAVPTDLPLLRPLLPQVFLRLGDTLVGSEIQEILSLVYSAETAKQLHAQATIDLINKIGTPAQRKQVAGPNRDQIERSLDAEKRAATCRRVRKYRDKIKKIRSSSVTHP
jgi:hypothetical protein